MFLKNTLTISILLSLASELGYISLDLEYLINNISALLNKVAIAKSRSEFLFSDHAKDAHNLTWSVKECLLNMVQEMFESSPNYACPSALWICGEDTQKRKEGMMVLLLMVGTG